MNEITKQVPQRAIPRPRWWFCTIFLLVAVTYTLSACGGQQGEAAARATIDEAAEAMGGWEAISAITAQELVTEGSMWEPIQALRPGVEDHLIDDFTQTLLVEYGRPSLRRTFDADRVWPTTMSFQFMEVMDGDDGMWVVPGEQGVAERSRLHPSIFATRRRDLNRMPVRVLAVAREAPELRMGEDRVVDGRSYHVVQYQDSGLLTELYIDSSTGLPGRVVSVEDDPLFGDTRNQVVYDDWRPTEGGIQLPHRMDLFLNDYKFLEERVQAVTNNPVLDRSAFEIPDEIRAEEEYGQRLVSYWPLRRALAGLGYGDFARPQNVEFEEVAPGVFHIRGAGAHSMLVEMDDFLVMVETPLFEERSLAVIEEVEERFPDKAIRYSVSTHFHMDHAGGVRTYAAKGATTVVHEISAPFFERALASPKTVRPDLLARSGARGTVEAVSGFREITDGTRTLELHHVPSFHAEDMLIAYLPNEGVVFVTDLYSPGSEINPDDPRFARLVPLYRYVLEAGLAVEQFLGGHGGVAPSSVLARGMAGVDLNQ